MLDARDHAAASAFLQRLYGQTEPDALAGLVVRELQGLVGGDQTTWNELSFSLGEARVLACPQQADAERVMRTFAAHMHEHPGIRAWLEDGATGPHAISDFLSVREYHRTGIYRYLYRDLGYEDQLAVSLTPPAGQSLALAFGRDTRGVSARDRALAQWLAPHVLQAYRNAQALARARRALDGYRAVADALGQCVVELDERGWPLYLPRRAERWLKQYFRDRPSRSARDLPVSLASWIRRRRVSDRLEAPARLVRRRGRRRLVLRLFLGGGDATLLVLEERTGAAATAHLRRKGLTAREIDVLTELEAGRTNAEAAAVLTVSPATVKKHLENIYEKLGVCNRTAAVALLRSTGEDRR